MRRHRAKATGANRPQKRVMLDYLGVPFTDQGRTAKEADALLAAIKSQQPELYKEAYDIIVLHKVNENDSGKDSIPRSDLYRQLGLIVSEQIDNFQSIAIQKLTEEYEKRLSELAAEAREAIKKEAKKFNKLIIENKSSGKKVKLDCVLPKCFNDIIALASARVNILLTGPAGCGKTFIAKKVAEALDLDFSSQSCSEGMSESLLTGWLLPTEDGGRFTYVRSEFVRLYENGGIFLFDEMDAADSNVLVFMNQALANEGFSLPQRFEKPYIKRHKDFVAIAATNTFGNGADAMYVGRNQLDAATLDRFKIGTVRVYYDEMVEMELIDSEVLKWGLSIRGKIEMHRLQRILSTRAMIDASKMKAAGWSIDKIATNYFSDWSSDELLLIGAQP